MSLHWTGTQTGLICKRRTEPAEHQGGQKGALTKGLGWAMCAHLLCTGRLHAPRTEGSRHMLTSGGYALRVCPLLAGLRHSAAPNWRSAVNYSVRYGKSPRWRTTMTLIT
jgi:hypothetical protein